MKKLMSLSLLASVLVACGGGGGGGSEAVPPPAEISADNGSKTPVVDGSQTSTVDGSKTPVKDEPTPALTTPGSTATTPPATPVTSVPAGETLLTLNVAPVVGQQALRCSDRSAAGAAEGQVFTDARFFISQVSLVNDAGVAHKLELAEAPLQFVDAAGRGITLLNFLEAGCAQSDATRVLNAQIIGRLPAGSYKELRFQIGLPYQPMAAELSAIPAALAPSDMAWMWEHYPADFQIEWNDGVSRKVVNQLTTSAKAILRLPLDRSLQNGSTLNLQMDFAALAGSDAAARTKGLEGACYNQTSLPKSGAAPHCAAVFKALGLPVDGQSFAASQSFIRVLP